MVEQNQNILGETVSFSVDAGIINRLGVELVGRAETAVSELVKNAYDADATLVKLIFVNSDKNGGELQIIDDGNGMTKQLLIDGFMRLSSSDKIHHPVSPVFGRLRAGKKGIGRFATQRLGTKLTILTKTLSDALGWRLEVDWSQYEIDKELEAIKNPVFNEPVPFVKGTALIIKLLREPWDESAIKRVYRYISDLLQPSYLSERTKELNIATPEREGTFEVMFYKREASEDVVVADLSSMVFENALGVIEGYCLGGSGLCEVVSHRFDINDEIEVGGDFSLLGEVHFKVYYFIYNYEWYEGLIPKMEYNKITELAETNGGIKLYRNGFRVLPYGEKGNDWINIDKTSVKTQEGGYVPFNNQNFFGFVEVVDIQGRAFEETSSREGLIENDSFQQLTTFLYRALKLATQRINAARLAEKKRRAEQNSPKVSTDQSDKSTREKLEGLKGEDATINATLDEAISQLEELEMMRILAGLGLNIAEFTHEVRQFIPAFHGSINYMLSQSFSPSLNETLINLRENFNRFRTYTAYIDHTITQAANRDKKPINLLTEIREFYKIIKKDLEAAKIEFELENYGFNLYTCPMHPSEWTSILYNFYTNAKKAIIRKKPSIGRIKVICSQEENLLILDFMDNGDGVDERYRQRIFDAFFTTSNPLQSSRNEALTGTGLGLKIVRDIISAYNGKVYIAPAAEEFVTCFRVEIPANTKK
jgi:signal transduction histidine kinase